MSSGNGELVFDDITPKEVPVTIAGVKYKLRECSSEDVCKWKADIVKALRIGSDGRPDAIGGGMPATDLLLISFCLYTLDDNGNVRTQPNSSTADVRYRVPVQTIRSWPDRVTGVLFDRAKELSVRKEETVIETKESLQKKLDTLEESREEVKN